MIVAVAAFLLLPPQQSEMLGQRASSQTVCRFRPRRSDLIFLKLSLDGMGVLSHEGRRVWVRLRPGGPTSTVRSSRASEADRGGSSALTKSLKEGPVLRRSLKLVGRRGRVLVVFGGEGSSTVVAKGRRRRQEGCTGLRAGSADSMSRRLAGRRVAIVVVCMKMLMAELGWSLFKGKVAAQHIIRRNICCAPIGCSAQCRCKPPS